MINPTLYLFKEVMTPQREKKEFWTRIGSATPYKNGGLKLHFDAIPQPDNDPSVKRTIILTEKREK